MIPNSQGYFCAPDLQVIARAAVLFEHQFATEMSTFHGPQARVRKILRLVIVAWNIPEICCRIKKTQVSVPYVPFFLPGQG